MFEPEAALGDQRGFLFEVSVRFPDVGVGRITTG